jgi:flavin reductase (DIM6/NTAB) family NADH-FMN oxidoreductase RutF
MYYQPLTQDHGLRHSPLKALVIPRPIGWISSLDSQGRLNLAPYSFFNIVCDAPAMVMFSSSGEKDSLRNCQETGEFVANFVSARQTGAMNASSAAVPSQVNEFELAGLQPVASHSVAAPRVKDAPAALECKLHDIIELPSTEPGRRNAMVLGLVTGIFIDDAYIKDGMVDQEAMQALARCGYRDYATVERVFEIGRPDD